MFKTLSKSKMMITAFIIGFMVLIMSFMVVQTTYGKAYAEGDSMQSIDESVYMFTITNNYECDVRLLDKTVERAIVPSKATINGVEYTVTSIAGNGFASATNLKKVRLPQTIVSIGNSAFANCQELTTITIPAVESIGTNAFNLCAKLEYLIMPKTIKSVAATILRNTSTKVYVRALKAETEELGWATNWNANNSNQEVEYNSEFMPAIEYKEVVAQTRSMIPQGYIVASAQPFSEERDGLTFVDIPATHNGLPVIAIDDSAFAYNAIDTLTISYSPNPINIRSYAFNGLMGNKIIINREVTLYNRDITEQNSQQGVPYYSEFLFADSTVTTIVLPDSIPALGDYMFSDCYNLLDVHFITPTLMEDEENLSNQLTSTRKIILPENNFLLSIGKEAFSGINLITELFIPRNVVNVGERIAVQWGTSSINQKITIDYDKESDLPNWSDETIEGWNPNWKSGCNSAIIVYQGIFSIDYVLNGGSHLDNPTQYNSSESLNLNPASKVGYFFDGWFDNETFIGSSVTTIPQGSSGNKTFYAKYTANTYNVEYNSNKPVNSSGLISGETRNTNHIYDISANLALNGYIFQGYTFKYWNTKADGTGLNFTNSKSVENLTQNNNVVVTLYAQWQNNTYEINYNPNKPMTASGTLNGSIANSIHTYDIEKALSVNSFSLVGWKFNNWNTLANGKGESYNDLDDVINLKAEGVVTIYAIWKQNNYAVNYDKNKPSSVSGAVSGTMNKSSHTYDTPSNLRQNTFSLQAWTVIGWATTPTGNIAYQNGASISNIVSSENGEKTLYAVWELTKWNIYMVTNGGNPTINRTYTINDEVKYTDHYYKGYHYSYDIHLIPKGSTGDRFIYSTLRPIQFTINLPVRVQTGQYQVTTLPEFERNIVVTFGQKTTVTAPNVPNANFKHYMYLIELIGQIEPFDVTYWYDKTTTFDCTFTFIENAVIMIPIIYEKQPTIEPTPPSCVAEGTLITLADGSQKAVELLTGNEQLLVWNLKTGAFDTAPILFIDSDPQQIYEVINLYFSDGTVVKVISEHGFWNIDLNKYVFLRNDAAQYLGHWFNKQITDANGNMTWTAVQLTNVVVANEVTTSWSPVTYEYLCYYVNGMLSMPGATTGLINIFEVDAETMQYDQELMLADIEEYGLFTYEEFNEIFNVPEMIFEAFGGQYLKVAIGKGILTEEILQQLIDSYSRFFAAHIYKFTLW